MAGFVQGGTPLGGAAVLPHQRMVEWPAGGAVPGHDGLALVGDPDGAGHPAGIVEPSCHLGQGVAYRPPDLVGIVLDPPRPREELGQLLVGDVHHPGLLVDDQGTHPGGAGIDGDTYWSSGGHRGDCSESRAGEWSLHSPGIALALSNILQTFANALRTGISSTRLPRNCSRFIDKGVTTLL